MKTKSNINIIASICLLAAVGSVQAASPTITKYLDQLPMPNRLTGSNMTITASEFKQQVLSSDFTPANHSYDGKTVVWGYNGTYPGPTINVKRGDTTTVNWVNNLGKATLYKNVFSVDQTLDWANPLDITLGSHDRYIGAVPIVTHLHGGMVSSDSDGNPDDWFLPKLGKKYKYLNDQEAATLWYHDHTMGVTRLNVHAGLAGFYLLRDDFEKELQLPGNSKDNPKYEREIVIQDKSFDENGQLVFPSNGVNPTIHPFWIPEFFGDTIVVNGKTWPRFDVEPRRYRLRMANGSNARFYKLSFANGLPFWQIGTDAGLLDKPVNVSELTLAPGERADVIVDFSSVVGSEFILKNTSNDEPPSPTALLADPDTTGQIMKFYVGKSVSVADQTFNPAKLPTPSLRPNNPIVRLPKVESDRVRTRTMTLNEVQGAGDPLKVLVDGKEFNAPITETPKEGATEIWEIVNLTSDIHPMHLHLVAFQLLSRQKFDAVKYQSAYDKKNPFIPALFTTNPKVSPYLMGKSLPPDANENGWKDTVRMNPGEVTRIAVRFAPTDTPADNFNAQFPFDPSAGPGYVWHCHIIDHEDNEMMRPYRVIRPK